MPFSNKNEKLWYSTFRHKSLVISFLIKLLLLVLPKVLLHFKKAFNIHIAGISEKEKNIACACMYMYIYSLTHTCIDKNVKYIYINYVSLYIEWIRTFAHMYILHFHCTVSFGKQNYEWWVDTVSFRLFSQHIFLKIVASFNKISIILRPRNHSQGQRQWANITTQKQSYPSEKVFIVLRPVLVWPEFDSSIPNPALWSLSMWVSGGQ